MSIAAAEQSKNFAFPELYAPIGLEQALEQFCTSAFCIVADPEGHPARDVLKDLDDATCEQIVLTVGPEAAYCNDELAVLKKHTFHFMRLTPTILRARQAAALLAGIIRSY